MIQDEFCSEIIHYMIQHNIPIFIENRNIQYCKKEKNNKTNKNKISQK